MADPGQSQSNINDLISRHEAALSRIEELKGNYKRPPISQRLVSHWRTQGNALTSFLFAGCFVALTSTLVYERRTHEVEVSRLVEERDGLSDEIKRLKQDIDGLNETTQLVLEQSKSSSAWLCPATTKIRSIIQDRVPSATPLPEAHVLPGNAVAKSDKFMI